MDPWLQAMIRLAHAQRDTQGQDEVVRYPLMPWGTLTGLYDPGIYRAAGVGAFGGNPVTPPQPTRSPEWNTVGTQLPLARNVMRDIQQGRDPVLTGSGLELTPGQIRAGPAPPDIGPRSVLDMLQEYLQGPRAPLIENWR